jgi:hypothetical protein
MPANIMDTAFPDITGKSTQEALQVITDYLFSLMEQLRYVLNNLGTDNFNETELTTLKTGILDVAAKQAKIIADSIDLTGYVTFNSLSTPGQVEIDGGNLKADGTITGQNIRGGTIGIGPNGAGFNFNVDSSGNVTLNGNITWGAANSPVRVQYSVDGATNWHDTYTTGDMFARYSYDGGSTWTNAMKVVAVDGKDGKDGSDATVPGYITSTVIGPNEIAASLIRGNLITIQSANGLADSGLLLKGYVGGTPYDMLKIHYFMGTGAEVWFDSPASAQAYWGFANTKFYGNINFSDATVTGLPYPVFE